MKSENLPISALREDETETTKENILKSKMNTVFEPMISQMVITQPKEPVKFMVDWLEKISFEQHNVNLKDELNTLRKLNFKAKFQGLPVG